MPYILVGFITTITILTILLDRAGKRYDALVVDASTKIERSEMNVSRLEEAVKEQRAAMDLLLLEKGKDIAKAQEKDRFLAELQQELDEERRKNESYKKRWTKISNSRPTLLARLANRATAKRVQFFATATCRTGCDPEGNPESSGNTSSETESNSSR